MFDLLNSIMMAKLIIHHYSGSAADSTSASHAFLSSSSTLTLPQALAAFSTIASISNWALLAVLTQ
jgi:hypothetical protein